MNKNVARPLVGFLFTWIGAVAGIGVIQKDGFFTVFAVCVQQDMRRFVKEGEPKFIVGLAVKRKLYQWPGWAKPTRHATDVGTWDGGHQGQQNARIVQKRAHAGFKNFWRLTGKPANFFQGVGKPRFVVLGAVELFRYLFAQT